MGEARRRTLKGLPPRNQRNQQTTPDGSPRVIAWLPFTQNQKQQLIDLTIRGGWVGIGVLLFVWLTVRIIGPSLGWWVPADIH